MASGFSDTSNMTAVAPLCTARLAYKKREEEEITSLPTYTPSQLAQPRQEWRSRTLVGLQQAGSFQGWKREPSPA